MKEKGADMICPHCSWVEGTAPESVLHLPPGTVLQEKYLIGKALGQGGFGITYLAWDLNLNLKLAIKEYMPLSLAYRTAGQIDVNVYKKSLSENFSYGLEKYLEEAQTLAKFNDNPNTVNVSDFFKANGTAYMVMNYIDGITLKEYIAKQKEPLHFENALEIFMPVLDALKEVHKAGLLHRDISPDNILITERGRVVLIDFGAARHAVDGKSHSLSVIMKPGFSPEEQFYSRGKQGPWTDIYSVAASIYYTITGQTPPESLDRITDDSLIIPSQKGVELNTTQESVLLKAISVKAEDRYQRIEEFQNALLKSTSQNSIEGIDKRDNKDIYHDFQKANNIDQSGFSEQGTFDKKESLFGKHKKIVITLSIFVLVGLIFILSGLYDNGLQSASRIVDETKEVPYEEEFNAEPKPIDLSETSIVLEKWQPMRLIIPAIDVDLACVGDGDVFDKELLSQGPTHFQMSDLPNTERGNVAFAGYRGGRYGFFLDLDLLEEGDEIYLEIEDGYRFIYLVEWVEITDKFDWEPIDSTDYPAITLQTGEPKHISEPDYRLNVRGKLEKVTKLYEEN